LAVKIYDNGYRGLLTPQRVMGILRRAKLPASGYRRPGWNVTVVGGCMLDDVPTAKVRYCRDFTRADWPGVEAVRAEAGEWLTRYGEALRAAGLEVSVDLEDQTVRCWETPRSMRDACEAAVSRVTYPPAKAGGF
jgi:hypothetical protein